MVIVAIGDKDIAVRCDEGVAWPVEGSVGGIVALHSFRPDRHDQLSFFCEFVLNLAVPVANPDKSKSVHVDIVVIHKQPGSPGIHQFPFAVVDKNRRIGTPQDENESLAIRCYRCGIRALSRRVGERRSEFCEFILELGRLSGGVEKKTQYKRDYNEESFHVFS